MKKIVMLLAFAGGITMAQAQAPQKNQPINTTDAQLKKVPSIEETFSFSNDDYDFGKIVYGKAVEYDVVMKNIGADSVKVERVQVSCGCTTPKYEQGKMIAPGQEFKVRLGFNGMSNGHFQKNATIFFSNGTSKVVKFHGEAYQAPTEPAPANNELQKLKKG